LPTPSYFFSDGPTFQKSGTAQMTLMKQFLVLYLLQQDVGNFLSLVSSGSSLDSAMVRDLQP